jgi:Protein of unknown function (DUF3182)
MPMLADATATRTPAAEVVTRTLVTHCAARAATGHDRASRANVAKRLAQVMGWRYGGAYNASARYRAPLYVVPHDALLTREAEAMGVHGPQQLFGGVVPHAFVATKAITHPLVSRDAAAPDGWSYACAELMGDAALRGYTAFARDDAEEAALRLLRDGPVRIKSVLGIGGAGQHLVRRQDEIVAALATIEEEELATAGVAIEEHLEDSVTYSVGAVTCGGIEIAYCGTQSVVRNPRGHDVYGGSTLDVMRGNFDALLAAGLPQVRYDAVELARAYDAAAFVAYPQAYASRRNYDVIFGRDAAGRVRAGVLEQSWRIGGASGAEVMGLDAFRRDSSRTRVRCATVEVYDNRGPVPDGAFVYYRGVDASASPLTKYAVELRTL